MEIDTLKMEVKEVVTSLLEPWRNNLLLVSGSCWVAKRCRSIAGQGLVNPTTKHNILHYRLNNLAYWYSDLTKCCTVEDL